ncbi:MAG: sigma-70 family RNA polymerase sigma factor [Corallococcus sp.]|nr:sigma-70 family RNA polymerase sigma factor [Corallococcus sp.]
MDIGAELYCRYLDGDNASLDELVKTYGDGLVRFAYCFVKDSAAAEDIAADTFATLIFRRKRFYQRASFKTYLYKIARNKCLDFLRYNKRFTPLDDLENVLYDESENICDDTETTDMLYRCLQRLPRQYRDVLVLTYLEGFSVADVTKIMGKSTKQVYNLLSRAKPSLKTLLINEGINYEKLHGKNGID